MELEEAILELCKREGGCEESYLKVVGMLGGYSRARIQATIRRMIRDGDIYQIRVERVFKST